MSDILVMLAVNNWRNGSHQGFIDQIEFDDWLKLEGLRTACRHEKDGTLRIGRRHFPIRGYGTWVGNWCWDAARVTTEVAQEIAEYLRASGRWSCFEAEEHVFEAWENGAPLRFTD